MNYCMRIIILLVYSFTICHIKSFVNILKSPPVIDTQSLWSRCLPSKGIYGNLTLSHLRTLNVPTPSYAQILSSGILSITSFSLLRKGSIMQFDLNDITQHKTLKGDYLWPNELTTFEDDKGNDILLVSDGFLMPGQSNGGLYAIVSNKLSKSKVKLSTKGIHAHPIRLTKPKAGWFYHRATYVRLSDGKQGIITARAHKPLFHPGQGELVWLHLPPDMVWHRDVSTDKGSLHSLSSSHQDIITDDSDVELPEYLDEMVLAIGPDVMFEILDRNRPDGTIDIVSAHFFNEKLSIHTIKSIENSPFVEVVKTSTIDTVGQPYGLCLATFPSTEPTIQTDSTESTRDCQYKSFKSSNQPEETSRSSKPTHLLVSTHECSYDIPSTINMALSALSGIFPRIRTGYPREFRDGESLPVENGRNSVWGKKGGSLFAYKIPNEIQQGVIDMNKNNHEEEKTLSHYSSSSEYNVSETRMTAKELQGMRNHDVYGSLALSLNDTTMHSMNDLQVDRRLRQQRTTELSLDGDKHQLRHWSRQTLFRGFKVRGWGGIFSPGAPGFPYVVSLPNSHNPLILLAGDCTGSAYIFSPCNSSYHGNNSMSENIPEYDLAFEVECGATVGSLAITTNTDNSIDIFVPSYELNKVHVFQLSERN